jgi:hypothetical protein
MKSIKYVDLAIQTFLLVLAVFSLLECIKSSDAAQILGIQLIVGIYQILSSLCSILFAPSEVPKRKLFHFTVSIVYLVSLAVITQFPLDGLLLQTYLIVPSWTLAIYYYVVSFNFKVNSGKRSKFLPNLGF